MFCTGGVNPKDPANPRDNPDNAIMVWCRDGLGRALNLWYVKALVLVAFAGYLAGALYGTTTIQEGLQRRKLSRPDSYSVEFYDRDDFYFREFPYRIQVSRLGGGGHTKFSAPADPAEIYPETSPRGEGERAGKRVRGRVFFRKTRDRRHSIYTRRTFYKGWAKGFFVPRTVRPPLPRFGTIRSV